VHLARVTELEPAAHALHLGVALDPRDADALEAERAGFAHDVLAAQLAPGIAREGGGCYRAPVIRAARVALILLALAPAGCAYEVVWRGLPVPSVDALAAPSPLTVAVRPGSFERAKIAGHAVGERFAAELRNAGLFRAVVYPVKDGSDPLWEIQLHGADSFLDPDSNLWKSFLAHFLPPLAFWITLENDYTLELEALVVLDGRLLRTYRAVAPVKERYQAYAPWSRVEAAGREVAVQQASRLILRQLRDDLPLLDEADRDAGRLPGR
jgi:hypothetical protein